MVRRADQDFRAYEDAVVNVAVSAESVSALAALGCLAFSVYAFLRSRGDNREEKTADLESRTNHIETFLEIVHDKFQRWRK